MTNRTAGRYAPQDGVSVKKRRTPEKSRFEAAERSVSGGQQPVALHCRLFLYGRVGVIRSYASGNGRHVYPIPCNRRRRQ